MEIRAAKESDLIHLINMEMVIIDEMETPLYRKLGAKKSEEILLNASQNYPDSRYNYRRAIVVEIDDKIAGMAYGFPSEDETIVNLELDRLTRETANTSDTFFTDQEVVGDEWYLDSLVVNPMFRGQGIGTALLNHLQTNAKKAHKKVIGLNVDDNNPRAKKLYLRTGFKDVATIKIDSHNYTHMQKEVD
ncbi:GNAT family N-acetyltransferase [Xylocopilactobacillus apis]|uniref:N-acetyltransferase n=1 Tax=Xylocopilactobacillus apis TaxID=2932183 RepID=A0AAU9D3N3_9LACO|nr:GNAT family N-acetyltransferase [Xylocopilactobacillus apis]BDR56020.1 N-acetyltransferase [Xylocopilactobacillus apis]